MLMYYLIKLVIIQLEKLEFVQYGACLAYSRAVRGRSKEKIYQELGLEYLRCLQWFRKFVFFIEA